MAESHNAATYGSMSNNLDDYSNDDPNAHHDRYRNYDSHVENNDIYYDDDDQNTYY